MVKESTHGKMAENMKENINKIEKMDMELIHGQMEKSMKDVGKMENNMEKENTFFLMVQ